LRPNPIGGSAARLYDRGVTLLAATNLRLEYGGDPLFTGVSLTLKGRDRVALSGANGAGKTTLLRVLAGQLTPDRGEIGRAKGVTLALHDQRPPAGSDVRLEDYVLGGLAHLIALEATLRTLEEQMAHDHSPKTLARYSAVQLELESAGGYTWREKPRAYLRSLGFAQSDLGRPLSSFSGGELTRASLARALGSRPDVLLLDEPTNHLDLQRIEWLERELSDLDAAVLMVAHDRWFLEATTTSVLELLGGKATYFAGPWHAWRKEKAARASSHARSEENRQAELARLEQFVSRFRYGTRARQAQAKLKQIGRLEASNTEQEIDVPVAQMAFTFPPPSRCARTVVEAAALELSIGDRKLLVDAKLAIERGEKVALVGANGSGKTTLIETLIGAREPNGGGVKIGYGVEIAYFSQHDVELDDRASTVETVIARTNVGRTEARRLLGHFGFSGDEQEKIVAMLSGGERRRLLLATVVAQGANLLVLDEPTNHLDVNGREALETALSSFPGAVVLVSHDRALLDAVAERVLLIEDTELRSFQGSWAELLAQRELERQAKPRAARVPVTTAARVRVKLGERTTELRQVEEQISESEATLARLEKRLSNRWDDRELQKAHLDGKSALDQLLRRWEELSEPTDVEAD
jgi:ATP-binding cassette subfamily F protein 3